MLLHRACAANNETVPHRVATAAVLRDLAVPQPCALMRTHQSQAAASEAARRAAAQSDDVDADAADWNSVGSAVTGLSGARAATSAPSLTLVTNCAK